MNMKQADLGPCKICKRGVAHTGSPMFFRVKIDHLGLNMPAIRRQIGLEQLLSSGDATQAVAVARIAHVMGPDEDMAIEVSSNQGIVCQECLLSEPAAVLWEALA